MIKVGECEFSHEDAFMNTILLRFMIMTVLMSIGFLSNADSYIYSVYNATPFRIVVEFHVQLLSKRAFWVEPGQTFRWVEPKGGNNLLTGVSAFVEQKYIPKDYETGILEPSKRLGLEDTFNTAGKPDPHGKIDPNLAGGYTVQQYHAPAGLGDSNPLGSHAEFKFIVAGPTYEDPNNARHATYRVSRVPYNGTLDGGWPSHEE